MLRSIVKAEIAEALTSSEATLRRAGREEAAKAIAWLEPQVVRESAVRRIAHEEAAAEARRALAAAVAMERPQWPAESELRSLVRQEMAKVVVETKPRLVDIRVDGREPVRVGGDSHVVLPDLILALGAGCHVFLVGPAGTGKSTMAQQAAGALQLDFFALSVGPTTPTSKLFGYLDAGGSYHETPFRRAYEDGGLMLLDEIDNGHPGLLTELNQALALETCAFADGMVTRHPAFRLAATGNTYGTGADRQYVGRQALDAATLDRFVTIDVPVDEDLETRAALAHAQSKPEQVERIIAEVRRLRRLAEHKKLPLLFSPRATINAAKLIEAGASVAKATEWCVTRGLSPAHRSALDLTP